MSWIKHRRGARAQPPPGIASGSQSIPYHTQNEPEPNDVFILVMGPTGSGKTSFINLCSDTSSLEVGHGLRSCTESIAEAMFQHKGYSIHMIETPGFDDTSPLDSMILMEVASYLETTYNISMRIDGLIYITRITDTRITGINRKNLVIFSKLVGQEALSKVVLATSMWDKEQTLQDAEAREEELMRSFWKPFIDEGSAVYRLYRDRNTALRVVDALLPGRGSDGEVLSIQRELVDQSRPLIDTEAGQELAQELQNLEQKLRDDVGSLKADFDSLTAKEDASVAEAMHREIDHLDFRISQAQKEQNKLHVDFRRLKEDRDKKIELLTQQIELERIKQAADIEKVNVELTHLRVETQYQSITGGGEGASSGVERKTLSQTSAEASKMKGLEEQLAELEEERANLEEERANLRREIAQKNARMRDLRSFMFKHMLDAPVGPPPPYSEPDLSAKGLPTTPKAQDSIEEYDTSQGPSSDDGDNHDGLKSPLARKQNHSSAASSLRHKLRGTKNQTTSQRSVYGRRAGYDISQGPSSDDGDNHDSLKSPLARKQNHSSAAGSLRHKLRGTKNQTTSQRSVYGRQAGYNTSQGPSSDDGDNHDGLKSPLARKQNHSSAAGSLRHKLRGTKNQTTSQRSVYGRRAEYEARKQLQAELYEHSLQSYVDFSCNSLSKHDLNRLASVGLDPMISTLKVNGVPGAQEREYRDYLTNPSRDPEESSGQTRGWLFTEVLMCRNMALTVYANCRRLQDADLAKEFFSILALAPQSLRAQRVVTMKRVIVGQVHKLAESLAECTRYLYQTYKQPALPRPWTLMLETHELFRNILVSSGLYDFMTKPEEELLAHNFDALLKGPFEDHNAPLNAILCEWRCACQVLDLSVLAYEGAHVSSFHAQFSADRSHTFELPEQSLSLPYTKTSTPILKRIHYRRLGLRCLSPFLEGREVWVFDSIMEQRVPPLYLSTDIETFADVWGPVWKVKDRTQPGLFSKYNVGGGSILPWEFSADMHPTLGADERLCHWKSSTAYVQGSERSSLGQSSSSSTTSSEAEESAVHEPVLKSFTGLEDLVIGADQSPRLKWKPCKCPVEKLKQHLKNAGRLDHIIASKSYRYVDSQQNSLVVGSHGVQAGHSRTWKVKKQEPLKKSLLDVWENEADSRDPREFENLWGVAVSLCTMNAQRVRLVELLGEDSVFALLRHFPWSDLSPDGTRSNVRKQYLNAVRSYNPLALGDLWDRHSSWRKDLGNAILVCLRIMFRTGYDNNRDEFHMLWLPPQCRAPRRVTLKPADQSWVKFLKDTTYSVTVAVVVEDSLGSRYRCSGNRPRWFKTPSILETAICINSTLDPAPKLIQRSGCQDENHYLTRKNFEEWQSTWDVSAIEPGVHLWMHSQTRVRTICPLTKWHLKLEVDTVWRWRCFDMIGMKPTERIGHWEYTDEEEDGHDVRPIPVHITS